MLTFRRLSEETMAGPVSLSYWWGEVQELWAEVKTLNWAGMREEWSDVTCLLGLHLLSRGWPVGGLPVLPGLGLYAARKFEARRAVWRRIFAWHRVPFENRFLIGGGNYQKSRKVIAALVLAGLRPEDVDEEWLRASGTCTE